MTTTLANLKAATLHKLGLTSDDGMMDELALSINAGLQQMATEYDWPWLITTSTITTANDVTDYSAPALATRIRDLTYLDYTLRSVTLEQLNRYDLAVSGYPVLYYVQNNTIKLAPIPDGVYTINVEYVQPEHTLVADGDAVLCPDWYSDILATYSALEESHRNPDLVSVRSNLLEAAKNEWIQRLKDNDIRTRDIPEIVTRADW